MLLGPPFTHRTQVQVIPKQTLQQLTPIRLQQLLHPGMLQPQRARFP